MEKTKLSYEEWRTQEVVKMTEHQGKVIEQARSMGLPTEVFQLALQTGIEQLYTDDSYRWFLANMVMSKEEIEASEKDK